MIGTRLSGEIFQGREIYEQSTCMFMLRWRFVPFILGAALTSLSIYGFVTHGGDPPDAPLSSCSGEFGLVIYWILLNNGVAAVYHSWRKAGQMRHGGKDASRHRHSSPAAMKRYKPY